MEIITFEDDFTDNKNDWHLIDYDSAELKIENSFNSISDKLNEGSYAKWRTFNSVESKAFSYQTKDKIVVTDETVEFGIIWGLSIDSSNNWDYSIFTIKHDKFYVGSYEHKQEKLNAIHPWAVSPRMKVGNNSENILKIMKFDNQLDKQLYFLINDQMIFQTNNFPVFGKQAGITLYQKTAIAIDYFKATFYFDENLNKQ